MKSQRFELVIPSNLKASAAQIAAQQSLSLSSLMRLALHQYLERTHKGTA